MPPLSSEAYSKMLLLVPLHRQQRSLLYDRKRFDGQSPDQCRFIQIPHRSSSLRLRTQHNWHSLDKFKGLKYLLCCDLIFLKMRRFQMCFVRFLFLPGACICLASPIDSQSDTDFAEMRTACLVTKRLDQVLHRKGLIDNRLHVIGIQSADHLDLLLAVPDLYPLKPSLF